MRDIPVTRTKMLYTYLNIKRPVSCKTEPASRENPKIIFTLRSPLLYSPIRYRIPALVTCFRGSVLYLVVLFVFLCKDMCRFIVALERRVGGKSILTKIGICRFKYIILRNYASFQAIEKPVKGRLPKNANQWNNVRVKATLTFALSAITSRNGLHKETITMGKLIINKTIQILVLQALIAILIAVCNTRVSQAAPYTVFGFDNPRGSLTNSNAAAAVFQSSVFDANTNNLESYTAGARNVLFAEPTPLLFGSRDIQYGITFGSGANTIYARSSRITQNYVLDLGGSQVLSGSTNPQYDDEIVVAGSPTFQATPVSGSNFMGGTTTSTTDLRFDFATTANTGNATGVNAFGFYGIDAGDTAVNNLSVTVTYLNNSTQNFIINPGGFNAQNDNTFFFGVVTPDQQFKSVVITNPQSATDSVGYDNFVIGRNVSATVVPEAPSLTGMLLGSSLIGALAMARKRKETI